MKKKVNRTVQCILFSWAVLIGTVCAHHCHEQFLTSCHPESRQLCIETISVLPTGIHTDHPVNENAKETCCNQQICDEKTEIFFSERSPETFNLTWFDADSRPYLDSTPKKDLSSATHEINLNKIPIFILTQSFLC